MKKRFFLSKVPFSTLFFLLFVLFGCMEEDKFSINEGNQSISASIIEESLGTRTLLSDNPTNRKMEVYWKADDAIGVFGSGSGSNISYQTQESAISKDGKTTEFSTTATAAEGSLTAYYPYQQGATVTPNGVLHLTMPATQKYVTGQTAIVQPDPPRQYNGRQGERWKHCFSQPLFHTAGQYCW